MKEKILQGKYNVWVIKSNGKRYLHMNLVSKIRNYDACEDSWFFFPLKIMIFKIHHKSKLLTRNSFTAAVSEVTWYATWIKYVVKFKRRKQKKKNRKQEWQKWFFKEKVKCGLWSQTEKGSCTWICRQKLGIVMHIKNCEFFFLQIKNNFFFL